MQSTIACVWLLLACHVRGSPFGDVASCQQPLYDVDETTLLQGRHLGGEKHLQPQESANIDFLKPTEIAESHSLDWMTRIIGTLWPHINLATKNLLEEDLVPQLNAQIQANSWLLQSFEVVVNKFELGEGFPALGPLRAYDLNGEALKIHVGFNYSSKVDLSMSYRHTHTGLALSAGAKGLSVSGELVVKLAPLIDTVPVVGAFEIYMLSVPRVEWDFSGVANIADFPGIKQLLRFGLEGLIRDNLVLPNMLGIPLGKPENGVDLARVYSPDPLGVIRVNAIRARNLPCPFLDPECLGWGNVDPFVRLDVSDATWRSRHVQGSANPEWSNVDSDHSAEFLIFDREQLLRAVVYDDDNLFDDVLGYAEPMKIANALKARNQTLRLYSEAPFPGDRPDAGADIGADLTLSFDWLPLLASSSDANCPTGNPMVVEVQVGNVTMPHSAASRTETIALRATVGGKSKATAPGSVLPAFPSTTPDGSFHLCGSGTACCRLLLQQIVSRMREHGHNESYIADITGLSLEQLMTIAQDGNDDVPESVNKTFGVHRVLHFVVDCADRGIILEFVDGSGKVVASAEHKLPVDIISTVGIAATRISVRVRHLGSPLHW